MRNEKATFEAIATRLNLEFGHDETVADRWTAEYVELYFDGVARDIEDYPTIEDAMDEIRPSKSN